ncbi:DUF1776-domain-containing protein [Pseudovirgaria hyperparasitica]|uniref:DUF1776-domain-containing protein n=1 Tax=Pseudovirgaria hyperparasitica TaxID=470096 RepID=A0A6A6VWW0_9PEZI|nr:DUF1776-domain-containing protein [Pseudovirgaria hyperparasitica]KAF2754339.1 DUF1776-domain-containing protein [Pseudovirgaria hyperparasitica]
MTSDDQHFLQILGGISRDIHTYAEDLADATDRHFEYVAASIREKLSGTGWLPGTARSPPSPPPRILKNASTGYIARLQEWTDKNRALTSAIIAFLGTGAFLIYRQRFGHNKKRRARRASNGARREVVAIAGPAGSPVTKSISLDLERRGFIVYIVVNSTEEEQIVQSEGRVDIKPLNLDIVDPLSSQDAIDHFRNILMSPHQAFAGASPHNLHLAGIIMVPDLIYPSGPVETVSPELWSDALNAKVLNTIATIQAFLPVVYETKARILVLAPGVVSSLRPAFHAVESTVVSAIEGFTASLRAELGTLGIPVCLMKLGTFDFSHIGNKNQLRAMSHNQVRTWPASSKTLYAQNYVAQGASAERTGLFCENGKGSKGSSLRGLHNAVFDALTASKPKRIWRVGRGSVAYDFVGNWIPSGVVGYMLGIRRMPVEAMTTEPRLEDTVQSWEKVEK